MRDIGLETGRIDPSEVSRRHLLLYFAWLSERKAAEDCPVVRRHLDYYVKIVDDDRVITYYVIFIFRV